MQLYVINDGTSVECKCISWHLSVLPIEGKRVSEMLLPGAKPYVENLKFGIHGVKP